MNITDILKEKSIEAIQSLYQIHLEKDEVLINATKPEFDGDYTLVLFTFVKQLKQSPERIGDEIGNYLIKNHPQFFTAFNVIKGFLNIKIADKYYIDFLKAGFENNFSAKQSQQKLMVEFASPNTNKPLHLGHLRNIFLGISISNIAEKNGNKVVRSCVVNDRGIHICKSMIAWQKFANGATPASEGKKGDHFVGDYYVKFNDAYKEETKSLTAKGVDEKAAEKEAPIMKEAQQMLQDWEAGKPDVIELWRKMNGWVYEGFDSTYNEIGCHFDKVYYESEIYMMGKDMVEEGLQKNVFFKKDDGSVWIDLTADGLDEKLVQRKDGTSVYITQDIALAFLKQKEFDLNSNIYVVGDEQNYHFKVLKLICQKLQMPAADGIYHLSYGMVELPSGKMKSREGTVVDADDIVEEMKQIARDKTEELGKVQDFTEEELNELYTTIGLGALKFFLLRVDPKKKMIFNPKESIDFHGFTGPFIQYTHARIKSILRKTANTENTSFENYSIKKLEKDLLIQAEQYTATIQESLDTFDPSKIALYVFDLAKTFNTFYSEHSIANADTPEEKSFRIQLAELVADIIKESMHLLGINVPERM